MDSSIRLRASLRFRHLAMPGLLFLFANGCATGLGPKAVRSERPDYNRQIVASNDAEVLLNLVRLRYDRSRDSCSAPWFRPRSLAAC